MNLGLIVNEVLNHLFEGYIEHGGTPMFDVTHIINEHEEDPIEIGRFLVDNGFVTNQQFGSNGFKATITIHGIRKIKPDHISANREKIISTLGELGNNRIGIMEVLDYKPKNFQIAFDLAKEFEREGIIEAMYLHNDISIKLTLKGRNEYEKNKADFF